MGHLRRVTEHTPLDERGVCLLLSAAFERPVQLHRETTERKKNDDNDND